MRITNNNDVFGEILWRHFQGQESYQLIEREDGFLYAPQSPGLYFSNYDSWPAVEKEAITFVRGKVLDLGAGAGRTTLHLQKLGYAVYALDNSPLAIKVCKERKVKKTILLSLDKVDQLKNKLFDSIILFGNNFGLLENINKAGQIFTKLDKVTTPDAIILAETSNIFDYTKGPHYEYYKKNLKIKRLPGQLRIRFRFNEHIGEWSDFLFVTYAEMEEILKPTNWYIHNILGSESTKFVAILKKRN